MDDSILTTIKQMLGIMEDYTAFDTDIIVLINSAFLILNQIGVGPDTPFSISDESAIWSDFTDDLDNYHAAKTLVYLRVKVIFDPPTSSYVLDAYNKQIEEYTWRLRNQAEDAVSTAIDAA